MKKLLLAFALSTALIGCGRQDESVHVTLCNCDHGAHVCTCKAGECKCPNCPEHKEKPCPDCPV